MQEKELLNIEKRLELYKKVYTIYISGGLCGNFYTALKDGYGMTRITAEHIIYDPQYRKVYLPELHTYDNGKSFWFDTNEERERALEEMIARCHRKLYISKLSLLKRIILIFKSLWE